jgi:hypothetical protein
MESLEPFFFDELAEHMQKRVCCSPGYDSTSITARHGFGFMSWRIIISLFYASQTRQLNFFLSKSSSVNEVSPKMPADFAFINKLTWRARRTRMQCQPGAARVIKRSPSSDAKR